MTHSERERETRAHEKWICYDFLLEISWIVDDDKEASLAWGDDDRRRMRECNGYQELLLYFIDFLNFVCQQISV